MVDAAREFANLPAQTIPTDGNPLDAAPAPMDTAAAPMEADMTDDVTDVELSGTAAFDATGDRSAMPSWDELVREHADRVYRLAYRLSGDAQDADDLTQ